MLIQCLSQKPSQPYPSNLTLTSGVRLPVIDANCIFTSRPLNKNSVGDLRRESKSNQIPKQVLRKMSTISYNGDKKNMSQATAKGLPKKKRRAETEGGQFQRGKAFLNASWIGNDKNLVDKLFKITNELGMNTGDYLNYMKTERRENGCDQGKLWYQKNVKKLRISSKKQKMYNTGDESIPKKMSIRSQNQALSFADDPVAQDSVMSYFKCNLKLKPKPQCKKKTYIRSEYDKNFIYQDTDTDNSIRGWTKYGKINQQVTYD